jgi:[protein-PII] uridylyltransferase
LALQDVDHDGASPGSLLEVFETQARLGADLSWAAREAIRRRARAEADGLLKLPDLAERLADLLSGPNAEQAGRGMLDAGLLGAVIPELEARRGLVQFDDFHIHPLGEHTIKTVARLADLLQGSDPRFERWVRRAARPRPLILAGLLHDVGKGDGDHARRGAAMAEAILGRLGADERTVQDVRFLVANHLLLFEASRTMDLGDETALGRLAMEVRSSERLAMLVLLSAADAQATGPRAWDGWIASLLLELADKLANLLTRGPLAEPYAAPTILAKRDRVRSLARGVLAPDFVESALDVLDPRYALANEPEAMVKDLDLMRQLERELEQDRTRRPHGRGGLGVCAIRAEPAEAPQTFHVAAAALDQPGLFAAMAGVFALLSVDVLDASIHTFGRGLALDRFTVSAASSRLEAGDLFERVRQSIRSALSGRLSLAYRIHEKRASPLAPALGGPPVEPQVCIDNETSDFFTVVEVRARDRLGLLFDLARTLADLRLAVHQARITTRADAVADVFFVRDELGEKILEPDRIRELTRALLHAARD